MDGISNLNEDYYDKDESNPNQEQSIQSEITDHVSVQQSHDRLNSKMYILS